MPGESSSGRDEVRAAEVIASLCLATDLAMGFPVEHGLRSTVFAMRLAERLGVGAETAAQIYYGCLLFYVGCTADAEISAELFDDGALLAHFTPVAYGSRAQVAGGIARALAGPKDAGALPRAVHVVSKLPKAVGGHRRHVIALCEVAPMLSDRLGMPPSVGGLLGQITERWDGRGEPAGLRGEAIPLPLRVIQVIRDAALQCELGGVDFAARIVRERAGAAFDPAVAGRLADEASDILAIDDERSAWDETLAAEPGPRLTLRGEAIDRALAGMGEFADLASPYLLGHSAGVAELATAAASRSGFRPDQVAAVRRAALVHDVGRVGVPVRIWQKAAPLTPDDWEQVRLHAYHTERVLCRSPFLAALGPIATFHHERLDGAGYHRGVPAAALPPLARLLAAADAYHAMTEPRPHREALTPQRAAEQLSREAAAGRLDAGSVAAVLEAAGLNRPRVAGPAGLTEREAQVVALLARGLPTKQIGRALGISTKTADRHVQNAYAKIGVSSRAAAALFAMQHGLVTWGELPIVRPPSRS